MFGRFGIKKIYGEIYAYNMHSKICVYVCVHVCVIIKRLDLILISYLSPNVFPYFSPQVTLSLCLPIKELQSKITDDVKNNLITLGF